MGRVTEKVRVSLPREKKRGKVSTQPRVLSHRFQADFTGDKVEVYRKTGVAWRVRLLKKYFTCDGIRSLPNRYQRAIIDTFVYNLTNTRIR